MEIRKAVETDIPGIVAIYDAIIAEDEAGTNYTGWIRGVYPTESVARAGLERDDLFVMVDEGRIVGSAMINHIQVEDYAKGTWEYPASDEEVMVLHTLVIDPAAKGKGYGKAFERFYNEYALDNGSPYLRIDTNVKNTSARAFYRKLGYKEIMAVPTDFNGLKNVMLLMLEKKAER
jgi:GNAT superfamily N-acetyltransferase